MKKRAFYDQYDYRAFWQGRNYEWQSDRLALERLLDRTGTPSEKLIDVGCGFGRNASSYALKWKKAVLLDPSKRILDEAKVNTKEYDNLVFVCGIAEKLPFAKSSFDAVVCIRVFHHIANPKKAIEEFSRVLKKGGCLVLEVANKRHIKAVIKAMLAGRIGTALGRLSVDRRSRKSLSSGSIAFINHHPEEIVKLMKGNGLVVEDILSVSNLRSLPLVNIAPLAIVLWFERILQPILSRVWFGPSIYFLARKPKVIDI